MHVFCIAFETVMTSLIESENSEQNNDYSEG